jgi:DNA-binding SARP family transcriptional activator
MAPNHVISISFFGGVRISVGERELKQRQMARAQKLFYFLVLNKGRFFRREYLADLFWPDRDASQGQGSLRTELWRMRTTFQKAHEDARLLFAESAGHHGVSTSSTSTAGNPRDASEQ